MGPPKKGLAMRKRTVEKAWSIVNNEKVKVELAKRELEKEGYKIIGVSTLPSESNAMIIGERRIASVV